MEKNVKKTLLDLLVILICFGVIAAITIFPYLHEGLSGHYPDLMYHLLRIESVKDSLVHGEYPAKIYTMFYGGYGYGSPLFYPDIMLVIPAILRLIGISPVRTWKYFALILCFIASVTNYLSLTYITKNKKMSMAGTFMIMLSQFYLADLHNRVGLSEYMAYIFLPILFAAVYDFFVYEKHYLKLFVVAATGLLLTHTIMTFLGVCFCVVFFGIHLIRQLVTSPKALNKSAFRIKKLAGLLLAGIGIIGLTAYYLFPMLEQMVSDEFRYQTPWTQVGNNTQPFKNFLMVTGYFRGIAYVGVGIPLLLGVIFTVKTIIFDEKDFSTKMFYWTGLGAFLLTTNVFPWKLLNGTIFNMIQFTYRLYPYAITSLTLGLLMHLSHGLGNDARKKNLALTILILAACFFGVLQNRTVNDLEKFQIDTEYLCGNSNHTGKREWLSTKVQDDVIDLSATRNVRCAEGEIDFISDGSTTHSFEIVSAAELEYDVPLLFYKGYRAYLETDEKRINLPVLESDHGTVLVSNRSGYTGNVIVEYGGTFVQKASLAVSIITLAAMILLLILKRK
ncbi:DUF6541 family protein [Butyrivibrio sp. DSM 10294]|uniref:DUF6541 family protein n=1 Tax=Butyrivibrio sp. DSM 10294 TaxID=2972457 RepID=UPI00234F29DA|nr:DUF6541 family protein [Butyrivibrio sp. DSM 10294]